VSDETAVVVAETQEVAATAFPIAQAVLVAVDQCRTCGTLWRLFSDDTYSLVPGMQASPCCDNTAMTVDRVYPMEQVGSRTFVGTVSP
jgi:hypothetical protein